MKKAILLILLFISLFAYNNDFKRLKPSNKYINIQDGKIIATKEYLKLSKQQKDSLLLTLKF